VFVVRFRACIKHPQKANLRDDAEKPEQRTMAEKTIVRHVKIAGQPFVLRNNDVPRAVRKVDPEPITSHFVGVRADSLRSRS
jgi:hypothetical protein